MNDLLKERLSVDEKSETLIAIAYRQVTLVAILLGISSVIAIVVEVIRFFRYTEKVYHLWVNIFNFYIFPVLIIIEVILGTIQYYYYFKAVQSQKRAIELSDQKIFGRSFEFFRLANAFGIATVILVLTVRLIMLIEECMKH